MQITIPLTAALSLIPAALGAAVNRRQTDASSRQVFAHYMVGLTSGQTATQWQTDIAEAQASGIDGFALNVGAADTWNAEQLQYAYDAASAQDGFSLFLSFDQAASTWTVDGIVALVNQYRDAAAQFKVADGRPLVSTFEGPAWADNWATVRAQTGDIYLVPDWSSLGASGVAGHLDQIDGAFNWGAWPNADESTITSGNDEAYKSALGSKAYMMGVSPYFYTNLPQYSKNWYSSSDSLWFDRWQQVLDILPQYVEIITWNDFGESSYINSPVASQIVSGAEAYVNGFDHTAFRFVLPYFINAYKSGSGDATLPSEGAMAWYRTTPASVCSDGGTVWGQNGGTSAASGTKDVVSVIALSNSAPGDITVSIGGSSQTVSSTGSFGKAYFYQVPFDGKTGDVTITVNGKSATGPQITNACPAAGNVNFNAVSVQV